MRSIDSSQAFLSYEQAAEIHFVVRTHGAPRTPGGVPEQIHTFEPTCDPSVCEDVQFAMHLP